MSFVLIFLIKIYQRVFSFDTGILKFLTGGVPTCRYAPSCSEFALKAIEKHGASKGLLLSFKRVSRCHGGHAGGFDPVPLN